MTQRGQGDPRGRRAWLIGGGGGAVLGTILATIAAASGMGGTGGLAFFLLGLLLACTLGTLYAVGTGAVDAFRGRPIGRSRVAAAIVLGVLSLLLPVMVLGLTGG